MNKVKAEVEAVWSLSLDTVCPECGHDFDLLNHDEDMWSGSIAPCETGVPKTNNYGTSCPECGHEFEVCFVY